MTDMKLKRYVSRYDGDTYRFIGMTYNARSGVVLVVISKWSIGLIPFKSFKPDVAWNSLAPNFSASSLLLSVVEKTTVSYPIFEAN